MIGSMVAPGPADETFRDRLREILISLLLSNAIKHRTIRVGPSGPAFLTTGSAKRRQEQLCKLSTTDLRRITFKFDLKTRSGVAANEYLERGSRGHRAAPSPHYRLLSEIAHVLIGVLVPNRGETVAAMLAYIRTQRSDTGLESPVIDISSLRDASGVANEPFEPFGVTTMVTPPAAQFIAHSFRWARLTITRAEPELGHARVNDYVASLEKLARRLLHDCIGVPASEARRVFDAMRGILRRVGCSPPTIAELQARGPDWLPGSEVGFFSEPDIDFVIAHFATATGLRKIKPSGVKKDRLRHRSRPAQ